MYFDYTIVLGFVLAGALLAFVARRRLPVARDGAAVVPEVPLERRELRPVLAASLFAAALVLLFPCALVVRDCLQDSGVAQSRGVGGVAVIEVGLLLAGLSIALAYAWKRCGPGPHSDARPAEPVAHERL